MRLGAVKEKQSKWDGGCNGLELNSAKGKQVGGSGDSRVERCNLKEGNQMGMDWEEYEEMIWLKRAEMAKRGV